MVKTKTYKPTGKKKALPSYVREGRKYAKKVRRDRIKDKMDEEGVNALESYEEG